VAGAIAQKLFQLSEDHQVLCVTHQPIVAAMADQHYRVSKEVIDPSGKKSKTVDESTLRTVVRIHPLTLEERKVELAQIASGEVVTNEAESAKAAKDFADSLLQQAANIRSGQAIEQKSSGQAIGLPEAATRTKSTSKTTRKPAKVK